PRTVDVVDADLGRLASRGSLDRLGTVPRTSSRTNPPRRIHESFTTRRHDGGERKEDDMRRGMWIGVLLIVAAVGIGVRIVSYHAGVNHGITEAANSDKIVQVVGSGYGG